MESNQTRYRQALYRKFAARSNLVTRAILEQMGILLPLSAALCDGVATVIDAVNLKRGLSVRSLLLIQFSTMFCVILLYAVVVRPELPALHAAAACVVLFMIILSFAQNILEAKGKQVLSMNVRAPIVGLEPLLAGVIAYLLFSSEHDARTLLAIGVGTWLALWSSGARLSSPWDVAPGSGYAFADLAVSAALDNLLKLGVALVGAATIPLFRVGGVLALLLAFVRDPTKQVSVSQGLLGVSSGVLFGIATVTKALAVEHLGLNLTILILLLEPGVIYLASNLVLGERLRWRAVACTLATVCLVALNW